MSRTIHPPGGPVIEEKKQQKVTTKSVPQPKFAYTKEHHFKHCLAKAQGKETERCPDFIVKQVGQHILQPNSCSLFDVKCAVRDLRHYRYHDQAFYIWSQLTGQQMSELTPAQTEECVAMFRELQPQNITRFAEILVKRKLAEQN